MTKENNPYQYTIENLKGRTKKYKEFDVFRFEYDANDIEYLKKSQRFDFHAFIFITEGSGSHIIDFIEYTLKPGRCFYISYGQIHAWKSLKSVKGYILLFTDDFYNIIYTGNDLIKSDRILASLSVFSDIPKNSTAQWNTFFNEIEVEFNDKASEWRLIICLLLKALALRIKRLNKAVLPGNDTFKSSYDIVMQYKEMINEYFISHKAPKEYAGMLNITPNYLGSVCKMITGKPAGELIKARIILEAKRLIIHTQLTISEITHQLGFTNKSHFGKYFKNYTKLSPDQFRKKYTEKYVNTIL
jgi:AraC family transcriptional regulator, transcriptional activator of pobA